MGRFPAGVVIVPEMVVAPPPAHLTCCVQRPVQTGTTSFPQTLAVPPPPQISPAFMHVPHCTTPPQPSAIGPQFAPTLAHVFGAHAVPPQTLGVPPPPQDLGTAHVPQVGRSPPQPSATGPQFAPTLAHVLGVQAGPPSTVPGTPVPHRLGPAPPQISPAAVLHVPQLAMTPPQPSPAGPQATFC